MEHPILLFDGHCLLCQGLVQWILRHDPKGIFHFGSQQSEYAKKLLSERGLIPDKMVYLVENSHIYSKMDVIIRIGKHLGFPWSLVSVLLVFPRLFRNWGYDWVAKNRYYFFGKSESCYVPQPEWRDRFVG